MEELLQILNETKIPFAYHHFAEGESPEPPFICYLLPGSNNFSADGKVYYKINEVHIELYTDCKDLAAEQKLEDVLDEHGIFTINPRLGLKVKSFMKFCICLNGRFKRWQRRIIR